MTTEHFEAEKNKKQMNRINYIVERILYTISFEELETELKKIADYNCVSLEELDEDDEDTDEDEAETEDLKNGILYS
jgi:hypothetical protein